MIQLEKYKGRNSRFTCPSCKTSFSFVRYIDDNGNYFSDDCGKCNRETKCGYHYKPKEFFSDNKNNKDNTKIGLKRKKPREAIYTQSVLVKNKERNRDNEAISTIEKKYLHASLKNYESNNFVYFLETLFTLDIVQNLIHRFAIGTGKDNKTIFWEIDEKSLIRTGRIMLYDKLTGKRSKVVNQNWIHTVLQKQGLIESFELKQCLFGLHQIRNQTESNKLIAIVEADKTAIIATALLPQFVWMSAGAKNYLNEEKIKPLANRKVILFPDANAFDDWNEKAKQLRSIVPSLKVSKYLENLLTEEQRKQGFDIADFLIEQRQKVVFERELYNSKVDAIKTNENLRSKFDDLFNERIALMMIDGNLSAKEAESLFFENIEGFVLSNF